MDTSKIRQTILAYTLLASSSSCVFAAGGISTDGSMGAMQTLTAKHVTIPQSLGTTVGTNLFHSFANFNINNGQTVTFSENTPNALDNVISRVTGGSRSNINGLLQSTPNGHAAFYLINPAGIVFGKNASIDVPASFHVSSADELRFQNGGVFSAIPANSSSLSALSPEAYGFLADRSADIEFAGNGGLNEQYIWQGTQLSVPAGNTFDVVGGSVSIDKTQLISPQGAVHLIAKQGAGLVPINELPDTATGGSININDAYIDVSGDGAGLLALNGGLLKVSNSQLFSDNQGDSDAGKSVIVQAGNLHLLNNAVITADSYAKGQAGQMDIDAIDGINILNGGYISSVARAEGNTNTLTINAKQLTIDGQDTQTLTGIYSVTAPGSTGDSGQINLNIANEAKLFNSGLISSLTASQGKAGAVIMQVEQLTLANGGEINSNTFAQGEAGKISVTAHNISIDGNMEKAFTGISTTANTSSVGNAGQIDVKVADTLKILDGGGIQNATFGAGNGGTIDINAKHILLDGHGLYDRSAINATATTGSSGQTGTIRVQASNDIRLGNGARISMRNKAFIDQPESIHSTLISINSPILVMDSESQITTESFGNIAAGNISLDIANWLSFNNALIITSVSGSNGDGGNISIHSPTMVMATGFIQANTAAKNAQGGLVNIKVNALIPSGNHLISGGDQPYTFATGQFGDNIIQAAAPEGLSGMVTISTPQLNLSGAVAHLNLTQLEISKLSEDFCATNRGSSLTRLGYGGLLPKAQDGLLINE